MRLLLSHSCFYMFTPGIDNKKICSPHGYISVLTPNKEMTKACCNGVMLISWPIQFSFFHGTTFQTGSCLANIFLPFSLPNSTWLYRIWFTDPLRAYLPLAMVCIMALTVDWGYCLVVEHYNTCCVILIFTFDIKTMGKHCHK